MTHSNRRAMQLMALGMTALATNDAILKHLGGAFAAGQIIGFRGLLICLILVLYFTASDERVRISDLLNPWVIGRGATELVATICFVTSLVLLPLALATTIVFIAPVILTLVSALVFKERVGPWRWFAVAGGFIGVALVTIRDTGGIDVRMLLPLATAIGVVSRDVCTRFVPSTIPSSTVTLGTTLIITCAGIASIPFGWQPMSLTQIGWFCLAAGIVCVSYFSYIAAIRNGELSLLAPLQYIIILWALLYGALIWDEYPDAEALIGCAIIAGSGILIMWRENVSSRRQRRFAEDGIDNVP